MTEKDEKDEKSSGEDRTEEKQRIGVKDGPEPEESAPAVVVPQKTEDDDAEAGDVPAKADESKKPEAHVTSAQAVAIEKKVAQAASEVEVAQKKTHEEHIDHVLTRGRPMKPEHTAHVRLVYGETAVESEDAPRARAIDLRPSRMLAEYGTTHDVIHAAEALRDAGYKAFDAHTPFPVHGMDRAMGLSDSRLGWIVLACGLTGVSGAWLMMFWMNGIDYPLIIGGKPPGSFPWMVPIMFELMVLLSAFGSVLGMLGLNKLPKHHDPLFYSDRFARFSNDKFFISVEAEDPKFDVEKTRALLEKTKPEAIEVIEDEVEVAT